MNNQLIYDITVIGNSPLSFIKSIISLLQDKRILHLSTPEEVFGTPLDYLSRLEFEYLKNLGVLWGISPLIHLDLYVSEMSTQLNVNDRSILLGASAFSNFREFWRTFAHEFNSPRDNNIFSLFKTFSTDSESDFNSKFDILMMRLIADYHQLDYFLSIKEKRVEQLLFVECRELINLILQLDNSKFAHSLFEILSLLFTRNLDENYYERQHPLLLIHMFSGILQLDAQRLIQDLIKFFMKIGGEYLESNIIAWDISRREYLAFQLSCYSSLQKTRQLMIMDDNLNAAQAYYINNSSQFATRYSATFSYPDDSFSQLSFSKFHLGEWVREQDGTIHWEVLFNSDSIMIFFLLPYAAGTHPSSIKGITKDFLREVFNKYFFALSFKNLTSIDLVYSPIPLEVNGVPQITLTNCARGESRRAIYKGSFVKSLGQASIEYIMLILVIVTLIYTVMGKVQIYLSGDLNNCDKSPGSPICMIKKKFDLGGAQPFKYYRIQ